MVGCRQQLGWFWNLKPVGRFSPKIFILLLLTKPKLSLASRICFHLRISRLLFSATLALAPTTTTTSCCPSLFIPTTTTTTFFCCPSHITTTTIMKLFNWMQSKFNGGQGHKNTNATTVAHHTNQEPRKEEFSDWPHGLLTIGTFGNNNLPRENEEIQETGGEETSSPDLSEFTPEEVGKLQKELTKLLSKKPAANKQEIAADLPLDRFLNCPSSLEVDRRLSITVNSDDNNEEDIDRTIRVILGRCKDICMDNGKKTIGKKSISFLFKKMFVCSSGFPSIPSSVRDPLPESRMEKLLRAMLKNKINPPSSSPASTKRKLIEGRRPSKKGEVTEEENEKDGSKWVKTDSEYIVLEI